MRIWRAFQTRSAPGRRNPNCLPVHNTCDAVIQLGRTWVVILADTSSRLALICFPEHQRQRTALIAPQVQVVRGRWAQPVHTVQPVHSVQPVYSVQLVHSARRGNPILVLYRSWVFPTRFAMHRVQRVHTASQLNWTRVNVINTTAFCEQKAKYTLNACFAFSI